MLPGIASSFLLAMTYMQYANGALRGRRRRTKQSLYRVHKPSHLYVIARSEATKQSLYRVHKPSHLYVIARSAATKQSLYRVHKPSHLYVIARSLRRSNPYIVSTNHLTCTSWRGAQRRSNPYIVSTNHLTCTSLRGACDEAILKGYPESDSSRPTRG